MNSIITKGLGTHNKLITQGYGDTLIIVVDEGGVPISGGSFLDFPKYIQTKYIKLPNEDKYINCDVLLIHPQDLSKFKEAILLSKQYKEVIVYNISEVNIK